MGDHPRMNIAVVGTGPVGTGQFAEGIPALAACLEELSSDFSITVYSLVKPDTSAVHSRLGRLRFLPFRTPLLGLDLLLLSAMILWDTRRRRVDLFHAIGSLPAGHVCTRLAKLLHIPCLVSLHAEGVGAAFGLRFRRPAQPEKTPYQRARMLARR